MTLRSGAVKRIASSSRERSVTVSTPTGRVVRDGDAVRLEFVRTYDAPVDRVWTALTEPEPVAAWLGSWTGDPTSGRVELQMTAENGPPEPVVLVECRPPTRLVVDLASPDGPWRIAVTLSEQGSGSELRFVQPLTEPYDASSIGPGWHYYLDRLAAVVAGGPVPADWDAYYPALAERYRLES